MKQMSIYLTEKQHQEFKLKSVKEEKSMNSIITDLLVENDYIKEEDNDK